MENEIKVEKKKLERLKERKEYLISQAKKLLQDLTDKNIEALEHHGLDWKKEEEIKNEFIREETIENLKKIEIETNTINYILKNYK